MARDVRSGQFKLILTIQTHTAHTHSADDRLGGIIAIGTRENFYVETGWYPKN